MSDVSYLDRIIRRYQKNGMGDISAEFASEELASLRATVVELEVQNAQLQAVIALNKYVTPPFDIVDDDTARLALECVDKDKRIAELQAAARNARWLMSFTIEAFDNRFDDEDGFVLRERINQLREWLAAQPTPVTCQCVCECSDLATTDDGSGLRMCESCRRDYLGIAQAVTP
jgi:hypothetical protein